MPAAPTTSQRPLTGKVCLITNCGLLQGGPDAAEFQLQGATLYLQAADVSKARPVLIRDGVNLTPGGDAPPVTLIEADFSQSGVADSQIEGIVQKE